MSNPLAIAAVTETLIRILFEGINAAIPGTTVTARPLDKARNGISGNQINIFMYQVEPNYTWRNQDMPFQVRQGEISPPPLALNLYYLITAYGENDDDNHGHQALGHAMSLLNDHPLLSPDEIESALPQSDLNNQFERVRISLQPLSLDETSKLWSAFQSQYRISAAYQVSVVLIESKRPTRSALPVLSRGEGDAGPLVFPFASPSLSDVRPPTPQPGVRLSEDLSLTGHNLDLPGILARFRHPRLDAPQELAPLEGGTGTQMSVHIPAVLEVSNAMIDWMPGFYSLELVLNRPGMPTWTSNSQAFALAPTITISPLTAPAGDVTLTITCTPRLLAEANVRLLFGDRQLEPQTITNPPPGLADPPDPTTLTFLAEDASAGEYVVRLRVDGVDSLPFTRTPTGLEFASNQKVTIT
jgi:hypothetical protein